MLKWGHRTGEITEHNTKKGRPLGIIPFKDLDEAGCEAEPGDLIILYTDGIDEAKNRARESFGKERILDVIRKNSGKKPDGIIKQFQKEIASFVGKAPQHDDMTLVVIQLS